MRRLRAALDGAHRTHARASRALAPAHADRGERRASRERSPARRRRRRHAVADRNADCLHRGSRHPTGRNAWPRSCRFASRAAATGSGTMVAASRARTTTQPRISRGSLRCIRWPSAAADYATALVAHVSRELLSRGKRKLFLTTDVANPTSNAIYARIGFARKTRIAVTTISARAPTRWQPALFQPVPLSPDLAGATIELHESAAHHATRVCASPPATR